MLGFLPGNSIECHSIAKKTPNTPPFQAGSLIELSVAVSPMSVGE